MTYREFLGQQQRLQAFAREGVDGGGRPPPPRPIDSYTQLGARVSVRRAEAARRSVADEVREISELFGRAKEASLGGRHGEALGLYTRARDEFPDLALSEYAKIGRALELFETGEALESILELQVRCSGRSGRSGWAAWAGLCGGGAARRPRAAPGRPGPCCPRPTRPVPPVRRRG